MTLSIETLKDMVLEGCFFTADNSLIEYLLERNLNTLEQYALLINSGEVYFFHGDDTEAEDVVSVPCGDKVSAVPKTNSILAELMRIPIPQPILMDYQLEKAVYLNYYRSLGKKTIDILSKIVELRKIKTESQRKHIEDCVYLNKCAYEDFGQKFRQGMNELEGQRIIEESYYSHAKESIPYVKDILSGVRTSEVSSMTTNYVPMYGETIILDLLPRRHGMYCDNTRTFFLGEPNEKKRKTYQILLEALALAEEQLRPGTKASHIHQVIMDCFAGYGLDKQFPHHGGHSFGHTIYEAPYFIPGDLSELKPDMIVALEPGLYFKNEFGIRVENNYRITNTGFETIGEIPLAIDHYIL